MTKVNRMKCTNYEILISSCEKFSDLWEETVNHLKKNWHGVLPRIILVTDKPTDRQIAGVDILWFDGNMPGRLKNALNYIATDYVIVTLDDYFLIGNTYSCDINSLILKCESNHYHYLQLYHRRKSRKNSSSTLNDVEKIDTSKPYSVSLYPAVWDKNFLNFCIRDDQSPWDFEPKLSRFANEYHANCFFCKKCCYYILDVVRKGKVLHKAKRYFKRNNIEIGDRPTISYWIEMKLSMLDFISVYFPKSIVILLKKIARNFGYSFFSDSV